MVLKRGLFSLGILFFIAGCASVSRDSFSGGERSAAINSSEVSSNDVEDSLRRPYQSPLGDVPLTENEMTKKWVNYFLGRGRKHMDLYLSRSSRYIPMMKNVLREEGLPEDLVYVALIESGFSPKAHSRSNAVGYWQFIRSTGKNFGLRIDGYIDERRDPVLSTRAAAAYFKALYNLFGSWHLSLAAYNTGENRVKNRVMRYYTRDFWELARRRTLPRETRNYVPKFIAAALIAREPERYGFSGLSFEPPLEYDAVEATNPINLKVLAEKLSIDLDEMKRLNPKFRGEYVPNYPGDKMMIRVPKGYMERAVALIPEVKMDRPAYVYQDHFYYRVRSGDTLSHIARRHRTSVGAIRRLNGLGRRSMIRVGQRLKVPQRGEMVAYVTPQNSTRSSANVNQDATYHTVRRGENLTLIARRYGVSIQKLKEINQLTQRSVLRIGQRLKLKDEEPPASSSQKIEGNSSHIVSRGENLTQIAQKYGMSLSDLKTINRLGRKSIIHVGQKLKVSSRVSRKTRKVTYHRVKRGENLTLIAQKYGVTVQQIRKENNIRPRTVLYVGKKLKVTVDTVHVVKRGENLSLIADKYNVSVKDIVKANDLPKKSLIAAGQALLIPN
ncbi:MAG: LysM peptidoglycan-binding domain-containing protein [Bdellovibrionales bacterium]|nr:LysM peptidoglycan-binding domain-containing protein [Bdellovibrionales bacterium]